MPDVRRLLLAILLTAAVAHAEDRGFITNVSYGIQGIVPVDDGALVEVGRNVLKVSRDGEVRSFLRWPCQIVRMAVAPNGLVFIARSEKRGDEPFFDSVVRTDREGNVLWSRRVYVANAGEDVRLWLDAIAAAKDGTVVAAGSHSGAFVVVKLAPDGTPMWQKRVAQSGNNFVKGIVLTRDGGVLVIGYVDHYGVLVRLAGDGSLVDGRAFVRPNGTTHFHEAVELRNGDFLVVGAEEPRDTNDANALLMRVDRHGSIVWQKTMGGGWRDDFTAITANGPDRYDILGHTFSFGDTLRNWIVTVDANGTVKRQVTVTAGDEVGDFSAIVGDDGAGVWAGLVAQPNRIVRITDQTNCDAVAEVSVPVVAETAVVETKRAMEFGDEGARIDADTVKPQPDRGFAADRECTPVAGPRTRLTMIPRQPDPEELQFLMSVSRMLAEKKFVALDALAEKLRKNREQFDSGEWKLSWFYQAFQPESRPLVALGTDAVERLIEQWVRATHSSTSQTALASFEQDVAWRVRGGGYWNGVVKRAREEFERRRRMAIETLAKLDEENACDAQCLTLTINANQLGGWSAPLRKLARIEPTYWYAFSNAASYLRPQWGGSYEELQKFAAEAADATRLILGDALYGVVMDTVPFQDGDQTVPNYQWERFRSGLQAYHRIFPKAAPILHELAYFAWRHADQKTAREAFENPVLRWDRRYHRWSTRQQFETVKAWALGPPAPAPYDSNVPSLAARPEPQPVTPPAPEPAPAPVAKKPRGKIVTKLDVMAAGKSFSTVAFLVTVGSMRFPTAILADATDVSHVKISQNGRSLQAVAIPSGQTFTAIVTLPEAQLPVESIRMTAQAPANNDVVSVVGCRVVEDVCEEVTLPGRISDVSTLRAGATEQVTTFSVRMPYVEGVLVTGAVVLDSNDLGVGVVRRSFKLDDSLVMNCESLPYTLQQPRTPVRLGK